jgi:hypothetical protein
VIREVRLELRLLWRSFVLPVLLALVAVLAIANVVNAAQGVRTDYLLLQHTEAEYLANGADFAADLRRPATVQSEGASGESIGNLARYDYDTLSSALVEIRPSSFVTEVLGYFGFLVFPAVVFLLGLWVATNRRHQLDKTALVRAGPLRVIAARQLAVLVTAAIVIGATILADVVARAIVHGILSRELPTDGFPPLAPSPPDDLLAQWATITLVILFFSAGGVAIGTTVGAFAIPAIAFLVWDFVLPIVARHDPRNWFAVLGHSVFSYTGSFQLAQPVPLAVPVALGCAAGATAILVALGYLGTTLRNPRAT